MTALYLANALVVVIACWALWVRRDAFGSRWDAPITIGAALYAVAAVLDSPWLAVSAASFPLTGKYYLIPALGHMSYLAGAAIGLKSGLLRILPDGDVEPFMRTRVLLVAGAAVAVMAVCVIASPATSTMSADYLYLVSPDPWLTVYFATFFLTLTAVMVAVFLCCLLLRRHPGTTLVYPLMAAAVIGAVSCLAFLGLILSGGGGLVTTVAWPAAYAATVVASLACGLSWRNRLRALAGH